MSENKMIISNDVACKINPDMIGLFFEDINFAADGGLYAEMIENRSFEAVKSKGEPRNYILNNDPLYAWSVANGKDENLEVSVNQPVNENNPHYVRFTAEKAGEGFANKAYDGIVLKKGMNYKISFYAKEVSYLKGDIEVAITKDGKDLAKVVVPFKAAQEVEPTAMEAIIGTCVAKKWIKYEAELISDVDANGAAFEVRLTEAGSVEFDLISMIPGDAVAGVFRKDLLEALAGINPGFVRFPGGCIVEGTSLMRRYQWKNTVGPIERRKITTNLWGVQGGNVMKGWETPDSHYMQSYGIGFYEYFLLCELLSTDKRTCKPLPVLNIGVACQFRSHETVPVDGPEFEEYVQDALDLIEFANGPVDSKWGALRASMGHPASFNMDMLAIGNEQWESNHVDLYERYRRFEKAIHDKYPEIKCLGTAGPWVGNDMHRDAWKFYHDEAKTNPAIAFAVDEHYYVKPEWLYENVNFYDEYPRDVAVFAGEYAAHDANQSNSMEAGLAEAAMMTGYERNGDVVQLASYAPLFNRIGHSQWTPDMIWFDDEKVVLTPSYYVQKMFADYAGTEAVALNGQEKALRENKLYVSLVKDGDATILKVVNAAAEAQTIALTDAAGNAIAASAEIATLVSANGLPKKVEPSEAIDTEDGFDKGIRVGVMSNARVCELRAPEDCVYSLEMAKIDGSIEVEPGSFTVVKMS